MWLLLCTSDDHPALWAANRLRARGLSPLVVLTPEMLHFSFRWQHRLGNEDPPSVEFTLADGQHIRGAEIKGVLNRIAALAPSLVSHLALGDQSYALQEWTALHISWLSALQVPVLNRPVMQGLCGAWRHQSEWTWFAARAGLLTAPFRQSGSVEVPYQALSGADRDSGARPVFVVDDRVVSAGLDTDTAAACASMGRLAGTRLLGVALDPADNRFLGASPRPDLRLGGEPLVSVLHDVLTGHV